MAVDPFNKTFVEFSCRYPLLEPFYMEWEKDSPGLLIGFQYIKEHPYTPIIAVTLYAISILLGKKAMETRKPFQWRRAMALWNLFLSLYSLLAFVRITPQLFHNLASDTLRTNLCADPEASFGRGSVGLYIQSFVWSKFAELIDTLFIIVHKKPLIFLHWYHHVTVLLYTWDAYVTRAPGGPIFMSMNCAVHFIMYGYYFLMTIKAKPKWMNAVFITVAQIAQMVVGVATAVMSFYFFVTSEDERSCEITKSNLVSAFLMYGSYLFLFLQFFVKRYLLGNKKAGFAGKKVD